MSGINRNIVECKDKSERQADVCGTVLIETLWNVKWQKGMLARSEQCRINRNIVECKG